jgi:preprotein translocase subunit SecE
MNKAPGGSPDGGKKKAPAPAPRTANASMARTAGNMNAQEFVRGVWLELKRVTWPTREEWVSATVLTIVLVVAIGLFTFGADQLFGWIFSNVHPPISQ